MIAYQPSARHDILLSQWWAQLGASGEFSYTFMRDLEPLSRFLAWFAPPRVLLFEESARGMETAVWFEPFMGGAFGGLWAAPGHRRTKGALRAIEEALELTLRHVPVIVSLTRQERLLAPAGRLGYIKLGKVPSLWDGHDAWAMYLTRAAWAQRRRREWRAAEKAAVGAGP